MPKGGKSKAIQRAQAYAERSEQRLLVRDVGREQVELAQVAGRDLGAERKQELRDYFHARLFTSDHQRFLDGLLAKPVLIADAKRKIDEYFEARSRPRRAQWQPTTEELGRLKRAALNLDDAPSALATRFDRVYESTKDDDYRISGLGLAIGVEGKAGPYDDTFDGGEVFWRGDTRHPSLVRTTGFTPKSERALGVARRGGGGNVIIYRTGDDDIVPASGVCIAKDIRGSAFFPFSRGTAYLYAVVLDQAVNTYRAQRRADRVESGNRDWRVAERFRYDPTEVDADQASTVWQYREHVVHRIDATRIVGAWAMNREFLVDGSGEDNKVGMRFKLSGPNLWRSGWSAVDALPRRAMAEAIATACSAFYPPQPDQYLSYQGIVRKIAKGQPTRASEAADWVEQVNAIPPLPVRVGQQHLRHLERLETNQQRRTAQRQKKRGQTTPPDDS